MTPTPNRSLIALCWALATATVVVDRLAMLFDHLFPAAAASPAAGGLLPPAGALPVLITPAVPLERVPLQDSRPAERTHTISRHSADL